VSAVQNSPPPEVQSSSEFQTDGRFDIEKWRRFLASSAMRPEDLQALESRYREELPKIKLFRQVTSDVYVSDAKLWQIWRDTHDSLTVRTLVVRPEDAVSDASVRITPQDLEAYHRTHQDELRLPALAYLSFVGIPKLPQPIDSAIAMARARALRDSIVRGADFAEVAALMAAVVNDSAARRGDSQGFVFPLIAKGGFPDDVYSIEDLRQLIFAIKEATQYAKPVAVKIAAVHNIAAIASGFRVLRR
jgi:peptidyl-prolyl cis-trans isomerase D